MPATSSKKTLIGGLAFISLCLAILVLSVHGLSGNPTSEELGTQYWSLNGPLELSPERGRFALLYSVVENRSLVFDVSVARLAVPDLAINGVGQYVSLFAPAVSFIAVPGYMIGKFFGAAQVGAFAVIALFAGANLLLVYSIARRLGAHSWAAALGALSFVFATPAFAYAATLYQHHVSVFLLLLSLWLLVAFRNMWSLALIWFLCALSVVVDNPNLFLMFPVGVFAFFRLLELIQQEGKPQAKKVILGALTFLGLALPLVFFGWYNYAAYGNAFQLPGTLRDVPEIGPDGKPATESSYEKQVLTVEQQAERKADSDQEKSAVGFFKTRNLYDGFFIHFFSLDRGVIAFAPVILLGLFGFVLLYRENARIVALLLATIGSNVLLYSMWGDPWGGWAFGSRYLIPSYALLAIGLASGFSQWKWRTLFIAVFVPLFAYSAWVNTLGAVTTSANPPAVQVLALEKQAGHEEKYTFLRNWEFLHKKYGDIGSKSFVYQAWGKRYLSATEYFFLVYGLVMLVSALVLVGAAFEDGQKAKKLKRS